MWLKTIHDFLKNMNFNELLALSRKCNRNVIIANLNDVINMCLCVNSVNNAYIQTKMFAVIKI